MEPASTGILPEHSFFTPDILQHVAEWLAQRDLRATLRELAMTCRTNFFGALPALYREISFRHGDGRAQIVAQGDALGAKRHSFIRILRNMRLAESGALVAGLGWQGRFAKPFDARDFSSTS